MTSSDVEQSRIEEALREARKHQAPDTRSMECKRNANDEIAEKVAAERAVLNNLEAHLSAQQGCRYKSQRLNGDHQRHCMDYLNGGWITEQLRNPRRGEVDGCSCADADCHLTSEGLPNLIRVKIRFLNQRLAESAVHK